MESLLRQLSLVIAVGKDMSRRSGEGRVLDADVFWPGGGCETAVLQNMRWPEFCAAAVAAAAGLGAAAAPLLFRCGGGGPCGLTSTWRRDTAPVMARAFLAAPGGRSVFWRCCFTCSAVRRPLAGRWYGGAPPPAAEPRQACCPSQQAPSARMAPKVCTVASRRRYMRK